RKHPSERRPELKRQYRGVQKIAESDGYCGSQRKTCEREGRHSGRFLLNSIKPSSDLKISTRPGGDPDGAPSQKSPMTNGVEDLISDPDTERFPCTTIHGSKMNCACDHLKPSSSILCSDLISQIVINP